MAKNFRSRAFWRTVVSHNTATWVLEQFTGPTALLGSLGGAQTPYPSLKGTFPFKKWIDKSKSTLQRRVGWSVWSPPRPPKRDVGPVIVIVPGRREKFRIWIWDKNSEFSHYSIIRIFFTLLQNEASPLLSLLVTFISYVCNRMLRSFKLGKSCSIVVDFFFSQKF